MAPELGRLRRAAIAAATAPRYVGGPATRLPTCFYCGGAEAAGMLCDDPEVCACDAAGDPEACVCIGPPRPACATCRGDLDGEAAPRGYAPPAPARPRRQRETVKAADGAPRCRVCGRRISRRARRRGATLYCGPKHQRQHDVERWGSVFMPARIYEALAEMAVYESTTPRALLEQWIGELPAAVDRSARKELPVEIVTRARTKKPPLAPPPRVKPLVARKAPPPPPRVPSESAKAKASRALRDSHRERGLCAWCNDEAEPRRRLCRLHIQASREASRAWSERNAMVCPRCGSQRKPRGGESKLSICGRCQRDMRRSIMDQQRSHVLETIEQEV